MFGFDVLNFLSSNIAWSSSNSSSHGSNVHTKDVCMFQRTTPSVSIFFIYGLVVPTLASFGLCANLLNAVVFMRPKMTPSAFTYLAALSCLDSVSCLLILLTALARSYFFKSAIWIAFDYQWQTPLFGISTGAANLILACVSLDRFIYLRHFKSSTCAPQFCRRKTARLMISAVLLIAVLTNLPYFFCFVVNLETGTCHVTNFYYSKYYQIHNWFSFVLLALLPAVFLLIGNTAIILAFRRWTKQTKVCQQSCAGDNKNVRSTQKRYHHQMKLTISILIVITLYMVGELPAHMTSRKSSLNLLFGGDTSKMNEEMMEHLEVIFITLNALQLSLNIVVYAVINPSFMPEFFLCLRGASDLCFRLCCLPNMALVCKRCCTSCRQSPLTEECVVSSVETPQLPADQAPHCGCESWSSDSACAEPSHTKASMEGTFTFLGDGKEHCWEEQQQDEPKRQSEPEVFATKESGCMQLAVEQKPIADAAHLSGIINM